MRPLAAQLAGYCRPVPKRVFLRTIWNILVKKTARAVFVGEEGIRTQERNCLETKPKLIHYFHIRQKSALVWPWCRRNLSGLLTWQFCLNLEIQWPAGLGRSFCAELLKGLCLLLVWTPGEGISQPLHPVGGDGSAESCCVKKTLQNEAVISSTQIYEVFDS